MRRSIVLAAAMIVAVTLVYGQSPPPPTEAQFEKPVRVKADGVAVRVERPGFAAPCWVDIDGDGKKDLLVGQFAQGKIHVFRNLGDGQLAKGTWLMAEGKVAEVPGVW